MVLSSCAAEPPAPVVPEARAGWGQLHLREATVAGTRVCYEPSLEPDLPVFESEFGRFLAVKDRQARVLTRREAIIADINRILGATDPNAEAQGLVFAKVATPPFASLQPTFYLVHAATLKELLRAGGQLPDFTYDRQRDTIVYSPRIRLVEGEEPARDLDICVPIGTDKDFRAYVAAMLGIFEKFLGPGLVDAAIHEVVELTLIERVRPTDPYWRWFSDGFSNAITHFLVGKHMGPEAAADFAARSGVGKYADLERELNLRYWMMASYGVDVSPIPVKAEAELEYARYAGAMAEAQALIARHGIDCVRKVLDVIAGRESRTGADLLRVIEDVTGADMQARLGRYQTFRTQAEGLAKYERAYQAAAQTQDYERMFVSVLRTMELRGDVFSDGYLDSFRTAAGLLFKMGREAAGDEVMRNAVALYSTSALDQNRRAALERFILYALDCDHPRKADSAADELLETEPGHVPSLIVKMLVARDDEDLVTARQLAKRVRDLTKEGSPAHELAAKVLAADPNQTPDGGGPAGSK